MTVGEHTMHFTYDGAGSPLSVTYGSETYYYVTNLQGDIVTILESDGTAVVHYAYDAWGNLISTTGDMADTLGFYNPLRYRGYVYDPETELYYLQSRYYNPEMGRFINADGFASTGQGLLGNNMFAYCGNNPVANVDTCGALYERTAGGGCGGGLAWSGGGGGSGGGFAYAGSTGGQTVTPKLPQYVPVLIPFIPFSITLGTDSLRAETIAIHKNLDVRERTQAKADALAISASKSEKPQYYIAEIVANEVVPFMPLTYQDATIWATSGGNLLCVSHSAAFAIVKFFPSADGTEDTAVHKVDI